MLRVTELARKNVEAAPIANIEHYKTICYICQSLSGFDKCGAKRLHLGLFCPHVCGLSQFEDLLRLKTYFSVSPALAKRPQP